MIYQKHGMYTFRMIGAAFGPEFRSALAIDSVPVKSFNMRTAGKYVLEFDLPVSAINSKFDDNDVVRVPIQAACYRGDEPKEVFLYKNMILLLPKAPVKFKLTERYDAKEWSKEEYPSVIGSAIIPPLGHYPGNGNDVIAGTVSASIPSGCLMSRDKIKVWFEPVGLQAWSYWRPDTIYSNENLTVSKTCQHNLEKTECKIYMQVWYKKPITVTRERILTGGTKIGSNQYLPFGTTLIDLSEGYLSFTLEAEWFNGWETKLTPIRQTRPGLALAVEGGPSKRLMIDVSWADAIRQ